MNDDLGVFLELFALQIHLQQLRRTTDTAQRIFNLMGQVAYKFFVGLRFCSTKRSSRS